jgi:leader peptidase (prepilin peptidase)/N-methyltransferase
MSITELFHLHPLLIGSGIVLLSLMVGSFLNVVIYRLPVMMEQEWKAEARALLDIEPEDKKPETFNLAFPSSHCPQCNTAIKSWQNIPVFSYLLLRGKCGNCQSPISKRYPIIEAVTALLAVIIVWQLNTIPEIMVALVFSWALICLTMIDIDHKLLPDQVTLPLLWLGLIVNSFEMFVPFMDAFWGAVAGYLILWSVYWIFKLITGKDGMGFGDFKLLAALGAWMGWQALPLILIFSSLVGTIIGIVILTISKQGRETTLPFGPYLAIAGWITFLWGEQITSVYLQFAGLQ